MAVSIELCVINLFRVIFHVDIGQFYVLAFGMVEDIGTSKYITTTTLLCPLNLAVPKMNHLKFYTINCLTISLGRDLLVDPNLF